MLSVLSECPKFIRSRTSMLICFSLLFVIIGCSPEKEIAPQDEQDKSSARAQLVKKRQCSKNFANVHQILRPTPENMDTELQSALSLLNQWYSSCAEWSDYTVSSQEPAILAVLDSEEISHLNQPTASLLEILYLRDQLLMREVMQHVADGVPTDIEKIRNLFDYIQRNITYDPLLIDSNLFSFLQANYPDSVPKEEFSKLSIPRTLQDVVLSGRGSGQDLTWLFASLIRQLNIDAIMVSPTSQETDIKVPALILVPTGKEILVFCPAAGLEFRPKDSSKRSGWSVDDLAKDFSQIFATVSIDPAQNQNVLSAM